MIISFLCPSKKWPVGGVTAIYEFANGLVRRGHIVQLMHLSYSVGAAECLDDLKRAKLEPGIKHYFLPDKNNWDLPHADFIFGPGNKLPPACGLPITLIQGYGVFMTQYEQEAYRAPQPKICIARWLVDVGIELGVPKQQLIYVPYGIDSVTYQMKCSPENRPLQVSMLYHDHKTKGAVYGLAALKEVKSRIPHCRILLFGSKPPTLDIPDDIEFHLNPDRMFIVDQIYNQSRVFVLPSIVEGFGFTAVEAMSCGCALVVTDNGGSADYAIDGQTACVSQPRDIATMANQIESLLLDPQCCQQIATRGRNFVQRFDWDESARLMEDFLQRYELDPSYYQGE